MTSSARPANSTAPSARLLLVLELRRALGDQRVALADERVALLADRDDHLAVGAERVRHRALVGDRDGRRPGPGVALANAEVQRLAAPPVPRLDLAGQLIALARLGVREQGSGRHGLARRREGRVDQRAGQEHHCRQQDDEPAPALAARSHLKAQYRPVASTGARVSVESWDTDAPYAPSPCWSRRWLRPRPQRPERRSRT